MKYLIAMDSFKGCLDADAVCDAAAKGVLAIPENEAVCLPLADGGEGTAFAVCTALGGTLKSCPVTDPFGDTAEGYFGDISGEGLAVIDTAAASSLALARSGKGTILDASTYGTGLQIKEMLELGFRRITVGLGGSGTNDGGTGAMAALGAVFRDEDGCIIERPCGGTLGMISSVDLSSLNPRLKECTLSLMYDVDIPLLGDRGCSRNYAPQKGADPDTVEYLECGMASFAAAVKNSLGIDASLVAGAGAAGGLGFGLHLVGGHLVNGAVHMLEISGFESLAAGCDIVITGEGRTDFQTAHGKLPAAVASAAKRHGLPVICVCGSTDPVDALYDVGIDSVFAIPNSPMTLEESMENADFLITMTLKNIAGIAKYIK